MFFIILFSCVHHVFIIFDRVLCICVRCKLMCDTLFTSVYDVYDVVL